jgi:ribosomal-protein-alanine N-acetyltransferase
MENVGAVTRAVSFSHIKEIVDIEQRSFQNPWSFHAFAGLVAASVGGSVIFRVATEGTRVVGYAIAERAGPELHLTNIAVAGDSRRKGIGRMLTADLESWGRTNGAEEVWLEVREQNTRAILFYQNLGYVIRGRRWDYYRDPREDALLMAKAFVASKD